MGSGASKPPEDEFDDGEGEYEDQQRGQQNQRSNGPQSYRANQNSGTRSYSRPQRAPVQEEIEEEEDGIDEEQKTPINRAGARSNANASNSQRQGVVNNQGGYQSSTVKSPTARSPISMMPRKNVKIGQDKVNDMEEDLPKFPQFVKVIKSMIPYPLDEEKLAKTYLPENYEFTTNTNVFDVFEEERLAVVLRSEVLKPYMVLKEVLNNEWDDEDFPNEMQSITKDPAQEALLKKVIWKKISEVAPPQGFAIIYDTNRPNAIIPGKLNNKAFQSALSILAETEHYLPSIFPEFNETSNSVLSIWLNNTGEWKVYVLDENFPYDKETSNWAFTHSKNETWVLILEKAFAKMYGSYFALEYGHAAHYIHDITGAPYRYFYFDAPEECWTYLNAIDRNTTMIVAMNKTPKYKVYDEDDLDKPPSYSYAILDLKEIKTSKGQVRLVKLRDPWKVKSWTGDWSNQSNRWTPQVIEALSPGGLSNDIFWISMPDFVKNYGMGFSFRTFPTYLHSNIRLKHSIERNYSLVLMNVQASGDMFLQVNQPDHRNFMTIPEPYSYSLVKMMVVEVDRELKPKRFVTGLYNKGRDCEVECRLSSGDYLVYIEVDWEQGLNRQFVFSTYGEANAVLYEINCMEEKLTLVNRFLAQYFKNSSNYEEVLDYGSFGDKRVKRYIDYVFGYLCFYYQNRSELYGLTEKVRMDSLYGLEISPPFTDDFEFDVTVKPNSDYVVFYETTEDGQMGYHYKHRSWSYLFPDGPEELVKKLVMTKAKKILPRKLDGRDIDIFVHIYAFNGGYCFYYNNKTNYIYRERLGLDLFNLIGFDNGEQNYFEIILGPKEDYLLKFKVKDPLQPFSYVSHVTYKINQGAYQGGDDEGPEEEVGPNNENKSKKKSQPKGVPTMLPKAVNDMLTKQIKTYDTNRIVQPLKYPSDNPQMGNTYTQEPSRR